MKQGKKILISERQFKKILEQVQTYDEFDYYDAFFTMFKEWVKANYGEEEVRKPLSFLLKKYSKKFKRYIDGADDPDDADDDDYEDRFNRWNMNRVIDKAIERGLYKFPTLRSDEKFLDRYGKGLNMVIENLELPTYAKVKFEEKKAHEVDVRIYISFKDWMKDPEQRNFNSSTILSRLKNYLTNFLGVEFGNPAHGKTHMEVYLERNDGFDDWKKNEYMKKIRPQIRLMEGGKTIKSIKIEPESRGIFLKITFNYNTGWNTKREVVEKVQNLLRELGYGPAVRVST